MNVPICEVQNQTDAEKEEDHQTTQTDSSFTSSGPRKRKKIELEALVYIAWDVMILET